MAGALDGVRVVDMTQMIAGPYCTQVLGDLGADVVKVEEPAMAPGRRVNFSPPVSLPGGGTGSFSSYWLNANRNKRAVTLDLRTEAGRAVLADLVRESDVVVENFPEHAREVFGLTAEWGEATRPGIIWASVSGFGRTGPDRARSNLDLLAQARGGLLSITGDPGGLPTKSGNSAVDYYAGLHLCVGILAALRHRDRTGEGQVVDISLLDSVVPCLDGLPMWQSIAGVTAQRTGNFHPIRLPAYTIFACTDGHIAVGGAQGPIWTRIARIVGRPDLVEPSPADTQRWTAFFEAAYPAVRDWMATRTRDEVRATFDAERIPNEPVRDLREIFDDPQLQAREMFIQYDYPPFGPVTTIGSPIKLSASPVSYRLVPPAAGEHTYEVLRDVLQYDDERIARLAIDGVTESYD